MKHRHLAALLAAAWLPNTGGVGDPQPAPAGAGAVTDPPTNGPGDRTPSAYELQLRREAEDARRATEAEKKRADDAIAEAKALRDAEDARKRAELEAAGKKDELIAHEKKRADDAVAEAARVKAESDAERERSVKEANAIAVRAQLQAAALAAGVIDASVVALIDASAIAPGDTAAVAKAIEDQKKASPALYLAPNDPRAQRTVPPGASPATTPTIGEGFDWNSATPDQRERKRKELGLSTSRY